LNKEILGPGIELQTDFAYIDTTLKQVMNLQVGDVLSIVKPTLVTSRVQGVPVLKSEYGQLDNNTLALRVKELINHQLLHNKPDPRFVKGIAQEIKESV
jgi:flagellar motor switch protein FliM